MRSYSRIGSIERNLTLLFLPAAIMYINDSRDRESLAILKRNSLNFRWMLFTVI